MKQPTKLLFNQFHTFINVHYLVVSFIEFAYNKAIIEINRKLCDSCNKL